MASYDNSRYTYAQVLSGTGYYNSTLYEYIEYCSFHIHFCVPTFEVLSFRLLV